MKYLFILSIAVVLAGCRDDIAPPETGLAGYDPHLIENQRAACEARGGRFGKGGLSGSFVCYEETRDANQHCTTGADCQGLCLARSQTCTPVTPFFGCHEILGQLGGRATICID